MKNLEMDEKFIGSKMADGYMVTTLTNSQGARNFKVHRLMARCFLADYCEEKFIDHKDGLRDNNCKDNLRMATQSENNINKRKQSTPSSSPMKEFLER